jgi:hypothetical protein
LINPEEELFVVFGLGQYPNLATQDAFLLVRYKDEHHVLRASRELGDRSDISVGPMRIEVLEGLKKLRIVIDDNELGITMDVVYEGVHQPHLEPRHLIRKQGRVLFDTMRYAQLGRWTGQLTIKGKSFDITPDKWIGSRDRSWGVRPVGEAEPQGIHEGTPSMEGMWNYFPVMFKDFSLLYILNETSDGQRTTEEAMRIWHDPEREPEWLGTPQHHHDFSQAQAFKCHINEGLVTFDERFKLSGKPLLQTYLTAGTGYGLEPDWRHGMYQGTLKVEHLTLNMKTDQDKMWGVVETPATFILTEKMQHETIVHEGIGMMEFAFFSNHKAYTECYKP